MDATGDAATDSAEPSESVEQGQAVVGGYVPRITFTGSGLPITPVYAGAGVASHKFNIGRTLHFRNGIYSGKPSLPRPVAYGSSYVPQHRGYTGVVRVQKRLEGVGDVPVDPMQNFQPQKFSEASAPSENLSSEEESAIKREYKNAGRKAYKSENKGNRETRREGLSEPGL